MTALARIAGVSIVLIGVAALIAPRAVFTSALATATPRGLVVVAALRIALGVILLMAARSSRAPRLLQALGVLALAAGVATPLLGAARAQAVVG